MKRWFPRIRVRWQGRWLLFAAWALFNSGGGTKRGGFSGNSHKDRINLKHKLTSIPFVNTHPTWPCWATCVCVCNSTDPGWWRDVLSVTTDPPLIHHSCSEVKSIFIPMDPTHSRSFLQALHAHRAGLDFAFYRIIYPAATMNSEHLMTVTRDTS